MDIAPDQQDLRLPYVEIKDPSAIDYLKSGIPSLRKENR